MLCNPTGPDVHSSDRPRAAARPCLNTVHISDIGAAAPVRFQNPFTKPDALLRLQAGVQMVIAMLIIAISLKEISNPDRSLWEAWYILGMLCFFDM